MSEFDATVRREVLLPAGRDEVWEALTDPGRLGEWFGGEVSIDARARGEVLVRRAAGSVRRGMVVAAGRPYRLVIEWMESGPEGEGPPSRVELTLEQESSGTRLSIAESALPAAAPRPNTLAETKR